MVIPAPLHWALTLFIWGAAIFWAQRAVRVGLFSQAQLIKANGTPLPHPEALLTAFAWLHGMPATGLIFTAVLMTFTRPPSSLVVLLVMLSMLPTSLGAALHAKRQFRKYPLPPDRAVIQATEPAFIKATSIAIMCPNCRATNRDVMHCFRCGIGLPGSTAS